MIKNGLFSFYIYSNFLYAFCIVSFLIPAHCFHHSDPFESILGQHNWVGSWKDGVVSVPAEAPGPYNGGASNSLVLAEDRTKRPDILSGFHKYRGGWDIANKHYWAAVGFTGAFGFILASVWLVSFGLAIMVYHCCGWKIYIKGQESNYSLMICLIMLIAFTCVAAAGCIVLSVGQDEFHGEAMNTLNYVVNQSDYTVQMLRNVSVCMSLAKTVKVAQFFLPPDASADIDRLNMDINSAADTIQEKTYDNSRKIRRVFNVVRSALVVVAAVMLLVSLLGLVMSIFGHQHAIYIFIISGWLLVAVTFILCGVFVILNNAIADTCFAMGEWVVNPQAERALSNILPCVDERTTNHTLYKSKSHHNRIEG
ncbi:hypothetical protein Leryth_007739 [Lithospermum erythrorhizon]|nr:hypothetical protein Leryth_007739 [Lithospermum erythrorhizon]